jgi:hypothetical protein
MMLHLMMYLIICMRSYLYEATVCGQQYRVQQQSIPALISQLLTVCQLLRNISDDH